MPHKPFSPYAASSESRSRSRNVAPMKDIVHIVLRESGLAATPRDIDVLAETVSYAMDAKTQVANVLKAYHDLMAKSLLNREIKE